MATGVQRSPSSPVSDETWVRFLLSSESFMTDVVVAENETLQLDGPACQWEQECFPLNRRVRSSRFWCLYHDPFILCFPQKAVRDRDFEALQGKVQRLEKLRRALKVDRNELKKKVQSLGGQTSGTAEAPTSDPGTDSPSPPPSDSLSEPGPSEPGPACSPPCQSEPQADPLQEEADPRSVPAPE